ATGLRLLRRVPGRAAGLAAPRVSEALDLAVARVRVAELPVERDAARLVDRAVDHDAAARRVVQERALDLARREAAGALVSLVPLVVALLLRLDLLHRRVDERHDVKREAVRREVATAGQRLEQELAP